jgi:hypothetical protein
LTVAAENPSATPEVEDLRRAIRAIATSQEGLAVRHGMRSWSSSSIGKRGLVPTAARAAIDAGEYAFADAAARAGVLAGLGAECFRIAAIAGARRGEWVEGRRTYRKSLGPVRNRDEAVERWVAALSVVDDLRAAMTEVGVPESAQPKVSDEDLVARSSTVVVDALATGADLSAFEEVFALHSDMQRTDHHVRASREVAASVRSIGLSSFRSRIAGKSIALIANSPSLLESGFGDRIEEYDLVMRFNSFVIDPPNTGTRTDIHVTIHMHDFNWERPVDTRIVLSGKRELWVESIKKRTRVGAQAWLGDASLHWPAINMGLVEGAYAKKKPTAGFNMMLLLDHLDVNPTIDLIGFDFYESGILRVKGAERVPLSKIHEPATEKEWARKHATQIEGRVISLRAPLTNIKEP